MASHVEKKSRSSPEKGMKPEAIAGHKASVVHKLSHTRKVNHLTHGSFTVKERQTNPTISPRSTALDRKAEEMKVFLAQNPIPEEFLKK